MKQEVDQMLAMGLLNPSNTDCGIIVDSENVTAQGGLRFENEMARHKILDFIGDFALADLSISMHNISIRTGHQANIAFAKKIKNALHGEKE
jgi:UDP-3-O-acyl-N-acetylglucosamine deacetylase